MSTLSLRDGLSVSRPYRNQKTQSARQPVILPNEMSNASILQRIAMREEAAFEECVHRYGALVWSLAKRFTATRADAEDAVQEIFVEIWQKAHRWESEKSAETTFITMIARRKLIDRFRKSNRSLEVSSLGFEAELPAVDSNVQIEIKDESEKALECMERLNAVHRDVLRRSIQSGDSHSRIAEQLGLPLGTVKTYARRSLIQLRECMERKTVRQGVS
ncbi:RNA polymerase sigma factor [Pirellulaceae bacterium SH501]